jgi:threonine dehydrogenase-like Zn-dependent dehydrogenase
MQALRFIGGRLYLDEVPRPIAAGESLIRVTKSGICNTDIEIIRGYAGFAGTIGHEFVGVVEESRNTELVGKRVVGEINAGCGVCALCRAGDPRHCPDRTVLGIKGRDGAHAEFLRLPEANLVEVPDSVSDEQAVFAEPLAAAYGFAEQVNVLSDTRVAVIGDGKLGILCALSLGLLSNRVTLIGRHASKLNIAERQGIESLLSADAAQMSSAFDVVVEASGSESGFATALDLVRPRGKIVLKSTFQGRPAWEAWRVVVDEITIVGSRCGRFRPAVQLLADGNIDVAPLISDDLPLSRGVEAVAEAQAKGVMKVLLTP